MTKTIDALVEALESCYEHPTGLRTFDKNKVEAALAQARAEQSEPVAWLVCSVNKDGSLSLEHAAAWQEAAHEHISDAITEHGIKDAAAWVVRAAYTTPPAAPVAKLEPVEGDKLPPVGSRVFILHGRDDQTHACTVTGYYAWGDLAGDKRLHRVFVRLVYEGTDREQARMLCDCYPTVEAAQNAKLSK